MISLQAESNSQAHRSRKQNGGCQGLGRKREWGDVCQGQEIHVYVDLSQALVLDLGCLCCTDFVHLHKMRLLEENAFIMLCSKLIKTGFSLG